MRIDVFSDDTRVFSEGKDEMGVWEWPGEKDAPENVHHDGVGALEHGVEFNLFALAELPGRGHEIELVGRETVRGKQYVVLKVTLVLNSKYNIAREELDLARGYVPRGAPASPGGN